tara:strand:+ start:230 stop:637 length:408 start_codon:yes stop_codon:yes gene_type:complete
MADKTPVKATFTGSDVTGLAEFQTADTIGVADGGTGLNALGSAGQVLKVNSGGSALEYGSAVDINIDGMTDGSGITIADSDKFAISDAGTEKYVLASNIKSYIEASTLNVTGSLSVNGAEVSTKPFAIAQAVALG